MLASATRTLASTGGVYSISRTNVARVPLASWLFFSTWLQPSGIRRRPNLQSHIHLLRGITCFSATRLLMSIDHVAGWLLRVARNRITDLFGLALKLIRHRYGCAAGCAKWALAPPLRARSDRAMPLVRAGPYRAIAKCQFPIANWSVPQVAN